MSFALQAGGHVVTTSSALLKAADRQPFANALSLLDQAREVRDHAQAEVEEASANAAAEGVRRGLAAVEDRVTTAIADMVETIDAELASRRADIAAAALAAARAIIGGFDEAEVTARLATRALDRSDTDEEIVVAVAPAMAAAVRARIAARANVTVREDPHAAPLACVLHTGSGRIIAGLDLQLDALAARWGVT